MAIEIHRNFIEVHPVTEFHKPLRIAGIFNRDLVLIGAPGTSQRKTNALLFAFYPLSDKIWLPVPNIQFPCREIASLGLIPALGSELEKWKFFSYKV